jgi:ABC-type polysaccharide/polyol phosphate export permease
MASEASVAPTGALVHHRPWTINRRVIGALLLREMLTRYGRNNIGFLWLFVDPALFTLVVASFWAAFRTVHGAQIPIIAFAVTGYSAKQMWRGMPSRCIGALRSNKSLLHHRQVTIMDIYFARMLLEAMAATIAFVGLSLCLYAVGFMDPPEDPLEVFGGWILLAWFGAGLALTIAGLSERWEVVGKLWPPFSYLLYPLSGIAFIVDALPERMQHIVVWLPMLNALELLRDGWFGSLFHAHYDVGYVVLFNLCLTFVSLSLARQIGLDISEE